MKITKKLIVPGILLFISVAGMYSFHRFRLKKVIAYCDDRSLKGLSRFNGVWTFMISEPEAAAVLLRENRIMKNIKVKLLMPDTMEIECENRQKFSYMKSGAVNFYVDEEGVFLEKADENSAGLPTITAEQISLGSFEKLDWRLMRAIEYLKYSNRSDWKVKDISVRGDEKMYTLGLQTGEVIFIPIDKDPDLISASLQIIISRFRIDGKFISKIDFSSEKPTVTIKN